MKKYILWSIYLFSGIYISAQVVVGEDKNPHPDAMLEMVNSDETNAAKALVLPVAADATQLPKYNAATTDLYDDDTNMAGMLMYQDDIKKTMVYTGQKWENAFDKSPANVNVTRARVQSSKTVICVIGFCTSQYLDFNHYDDTKYVDHLNMKSGNPTTLVARQKGLYRVNVSLEVTGSQIFSNSIEVGAEVNGAIRTTMIQTPTQIFGGRYIVAEEFSLFLNQGDEVRFQLNSNGFLNGFSYQVSDYSAILIERTM